MRRSLPLHRAPARRVFLSAASGAAALVRRVSTITPILIDAVANGAASAVFSAGVGISFTQAYKHSLVSRIAVRFTPDNQRFSHDITRLETGKGTAEEGQLQKCTTNCTLKADTEHAVELVLFNRPRTGFWERLGEWVMPSRDGRDVNSYIHFPSDLIEVLQFYRLEDSEEAKKQRPAIQQSMFKGYSLVVFPRGPGQQSIKVLPAGLGISATLKFKLRDGVPKDDTIVHLFAATVSSQDLPIHVRDQLKICISK